MALSDNTTPPRYNLSNLITGSNAIVGEFVLSGFVGPIQYTGPYYTIIKSGAKEYYTGKLPDSRNDNGKGKNLSNGSEIKVGSNHRLQKFSEAGITSSTGLFEPELYDISKEVNIIQYYNGVIRRFFARRISDNTYRETNYTSFLKISTKDPQWDFNNWEVKEVYGGWGINYFTPSPSKYQPEVPIYSGLYEINKAKILAIEKGEKFLSPSISPPFPTSNGVPPSTDQNSTTPWPGFKNWYCVKYGGNFKESYFTILDKSGNYISNGIYISPNPTTTPTSAVSIQFHIKDDPKIPLSVRFYTYTQKYSSLSNIREIGIGNKNNSILPQAISDAIPFLYLATPVVRDVNPKNETELDNKKVYTPNEGTQKEYNKNTICNTSEIFLNSPKNTSNPNALASNPLPDLIDPTTNIKYKGTFCKDIEGNYWNGLVPPSGFNKQISGDKILKKV